MFFHISPLCSVDQSLVKLLPCKRTSLKRQTCFVPQTAAIGRNFLEIWMVPELPLAKHMLVKVMTGRCASKILERICWFLLLWHARKWAHSHFQEGQNLVLTPSKNTLNLLYSQRSGGLPLFQSCPGRWHSASGNTILYSIFKPIHQKLLTVPRATKREHRLRGVAFHLHPTPADGKSQVFLEHIFMEVGFLSCLETGFTTAAWNEWSHFWMGGCPSVEIGNQRMTVNNCYSILVNYVVIYCVSEFGYHFRHVDLKLVEHVYGLSFPNNLKPPLLEVDLRPQTKTSMFYNSFKD